MEKFLSKLNATRLYAISFIGYLLHSLPEMIVCRMVPYYSNSSRAFIYFRSVYGSSKGLSEYIDKVIFGRKYENGGNNYDDQNQSKLNHCLTELNSKGFVSFGTFNCKDLMADIRTTMFRSRINPCAQLKYADLVNRQNCFGRWDADLDILYSSVSFVKLLTSILSDSIITRIIGSKYIITSSVVWASFPCRNLHESIVSAQVFHVDIDYLDDIKIFINLLPTYLESGPLEYISGSHKPLRKKIYKDDWIAEETISELYDPSCHSFFTGNSGAAYISNNRGIHRDHPPEDGFHKIAMQINLSRSQFGSEYIYKSYRTELSPTWESYKIWQNAIGSNPRMYSLLFR
jgi:hypothetical protein